MRSDKILAVAGIMFAAACAFGRVSIANAQGVSGEGAYRASKLDRIAVRGWSWLYTGKVPLKYKLLDLTDEQEAALEELVVEAKDAWRETQQETRRLYKQNRDRSVFKQQQGKMEALRKTYETRISDVLTKEQRDALKKIDELAAERQAKISEIYKEMNAKVQKLRVSYDEKLLGLLTPEQKECLEALLERKGTPMGGTRSVPGGRKIDPGAGYEAF